MILTSPNEVFEHRAIALAKTSLCRRMQVGAVLVKGGLIVGEGVNNPVMGGGCATCRRIEQGIPSGTRYEECRSLHAEQQAVITAGTEAKGATLYLICLNPESGAPINRPPCPICARLLLGAGVRDVVRTLDEKGVGYLWDIAGYYQDRGQL